MNSWWLWLIVGMVLVGGPVILLWDWRLDRAYADGWDQAADRIKLRQVKRLLAGHVLMIDEHGPYWHDPYSRSEPVGSLEDGPGSPASGGELAITPGPGSEPSGATGPALAPNGSKLLNDRQVRAELAALADVEGGRALDYANDPGWRPEFETSAATSPAAGQGSRPPLLLGGAGPEPPGPRCVISAEDGSIAGSNPAGPGEAGPGSEPSGATGPVPPDRDPLFSLIEDDGEAFKLIRWDFARLHAMVAQPYKLTGWSAA